MAMIRVELSREQCREQAREIVTLDGLRASLFRFPTGVEALRLANARGHVLILPWMGQMVWDAVFDGVPLAMDSLFPAPRPAQGIIDTYGCFAFHSGLLRNGCPGPEDDHPLHGEFPCAAMDRAWLEAGEDARGAFLRLAGEREHAVGFGSRYLASPSVEIRADSTLFDIGLTARNLAGRPMELMYMCHVNFAFVPGGRFVQPAPFTPEATVVRTAIPAHVPATEPYRAFLRTLAEDPGRMHTLDEPERYDPEQVFYLHGLRSDADGCTHLMLRRPEGDGFAMSYAPAAFPHTVRWVLCGPDEKVAAFALPSTCEPEGYAAEKRKGNVRSLAPQQVADFRVTCGYLDAAAADRMETRIASL